MGLVCSPRREQLLITNLKNVCNCTPRRRKPQAGPDCRQEHSTGSHVPGLAVHLCCKTGHWQCCQVHWSWSCHCWSCRLWSWNRVSVRIAYHRLRKKPQSETATFLLRHFGICSVRGYGTFLSYDGFPAP